MSAQIDPLDRVDEEALLRVVVARRQKLANVTEAATDGEGVNLDDFHAVMPLHSYIYAPTREMWPAASVNARIPRSP